MGQRSQPVYGYRLQEIDQSTRHLYECGVWAVARKHSMDILQHSWFSDPEFQLLVFLAYIIILKE
jgi:hypothetical protein